MNVETSQKPWPPQITGSISLTKEVDQECWNNHVRETLGLSIVLANHYKLETKTCETLVNLCCIKSPTRQILLTELSQCDEFCECVIRLNESAFFREVNSNTGIPYPFVDITPATPYHKVMLLVQIQLSRIEWPNKLSSAARKDLLREYGFIEKFLVRILRALIELFGQVGHGRGVIVGLDLLRSIRAGIWDGGPSELYQVSGIGAARLQKLHNAGITSIRKLCEKEDYHIERLLSRNPPFGHTMKRQLSGFPMLRFRVDILRESEIACSERVKSQKTQWDVQLVLGYDNTAVPMWKSRPPMVTFVIEGENGRLVWFWRGTAARLVGDKTMVVRIGANEGEELKVILAAEEVVGTRIESCFIV